LHSSCINQKLQFCRLHDKAYAIWRIGFHIRDFKYPSKIDVNILPTTKNIGTSYSHHHSSLSLAGRFILNSNLPKCLIQLIAFCLPMLKNDPFVISQLQLISTLKWSQWFIPKQFFSYCPYASSSHQRRTQGLSGSFFFCSLTLNYLFWKKKKLLMKSPLSFFWFCDTEHTQHQDHDNLFHKVCLKLTCHNRKARFSCCTF
jgi:hypothetical protein